MMAASLSRPRATIASRVARTAASATTSTAGAGEFRALDGALGHARKEALQPVVVRVMQMIGLGGGEQDAVDARPEQRARERRAAGAE